MALHKLYSYNVEIQYKNYLFSKAALFTTLTAILNITLPFLIAYRSKGFWLQSHYFYEQPTVRSSYEYLLVAETDDPSVNIICGQTVSFSAVESEEYCAFTEIQEDDFNKDGKYDIFKFKIKLIIPPERNIISIFLVLGIDFQIMNSCPLQMQSLAIINREFNVPPSGFNFYGDLSVYQRTHLPCLRNVLDTRYNKSLFTSVNNGNKNIVDFIIEEYFSREVITTVNNMLPKSRNGHTGTLDLNFIFRIPEIQIRYSPSLLQELKWAWPQYLSLVFIFYYLIDRMKKFVFTKRLFMAWEIVPWKKD